MKSIWRDSNFKSFKGLSGDISTDVLIIGGGISGLLTAYFLDRAGVDYLLVEKNKICSGVTANTTAKITVGQGFNYHKILSLRGKETAQAYYHANKRAVKEYFSLCKNIDCDFEVKDNFVYSFEKHKIEKELEALEKIGCKAEYCDKLNLPFETA
ncbi:MAG: FAD-binding oxidoreductase, partial [Clostridia bacterium]|nr:FAD-binding oxidoreductase [Clostridia bacterium]